MYQWTNNNAAFTQVKAFLLRRRNSMSPLPGNCIALSPRPGSHEEAQEMLLSKVNTGTPRLPLPEHELKVAVAEGKLTRVILRGVYAV